MRRSSRLRSHEDDAGVPTKRQKVDNDEGDTVVGVQSPERAAWSEFLRAKTFFRPPKDFFDVFALAKELRPENPCDAFVDTLGIRLCGPLDLLATTDKEVTVDKPLYLQGRFYFDPPEVTTVMMDSESLVGQHWGYFRDAPDQVPEYVVQAQNSQECKFDIVGGGLFQVLETRLKERRSALGSGKAAELLAKIKAHCGILEGKSISMLLRKRSKDSVASSLHGLGIVVPVNTKTNTGYRELPTTGADLEELLRQVKNEASKKAAGSARKRLSELITRATIASDECDFGTGLLLGLDVFTVDSCLEKETLQLLRVAYMLLRRAEFYKIASGQCKFRSQDDSNSLIRSIVSQTSEQKPSDKQPKLSKIELPSHSGCRFTNTISGTAVKAASGNFDVGTLHYT